MDRAREREQERQAGGDAESSITWTQRNLGTNTDMLHLLLCVEKCHHQTQFKNLADKHSFVANK